MRQRSHGQGRDHAGEDGRQDKENELAPFRHQGCGHEQQHARQGASDDDRTGAGDERDMGARRNDGGKAGDAVKEECGRRAQTGAKVARPPDGQRRQEGERRHEAADDLDGHGRGEPLPEERLECRNRKDMEAHRDNREGAQKPMP